MKKKIMRKTCMVWVLVFQVILMGCRVAMGGTLEFSDLSLVAIICMAWAFELYAKQSEEVIEKLKAEILVKAMANEELADKICLTEGKIRELEELNDSLMDQMRSMSEYSQVNVMYDGSAEGEEVQNGL